MFATQSSQHDTPKVGWLGPRRPSHLNANLGLSPGETTLPSGPRSIWRLAESLPGNPYSLLTFNQHGERQRTLHPRRNDDEGYAIPTEKALQGEDNRIVEEPRDHGFLLESQLATKDDCVGISR